MVNFFFISIYHAEKNEEKEERYTSPSMPSFSLSFPAMPRPPKRIPPRPQRFESSEKKDKDKKTHPQPTNPKRHTTHEAKQIRKTGTENDPSLIRKTKNFKKNPRKKSSAKMPLKKTTNPHTMMTHSELMSLPKKKR